MSVSGGQESCKLAGDSRHGGCFVDVNLDVLWEKERKRNKMEMVDPQNIASANVCVIRSDPGVSAHSTKPVHVHCMT